MSELNYKKSEIKLYQSLFILYKCNQTVNKTWLLYQNSKGNNFLLFHMILELENFNEEYKKYFNCKRIPQYKIRINQIRYIVKPVYDEIKMWNLRQYRNSIIAHPWRRNVEFVSPDSGKYKVPKDEFEFLFLKYYLGYIWSLISVEFKQELKEAIGYMLSLQQTPRREKDFSNINSIQKDIVEEVNSRCKEFDKSYYLKVQFYEIEK